MTDASDTVAAARRIPLPRPGVGQTRARMAEMLRVDHAGQHGPSAAARVLLLRQQHDGGAVGQRGRVARRHARVLALPEDGAELGERLRRRLGAEDAVAGDAEVLAVQDLDVGQVHQVAGDVGGLGSLVADGEHVGRFVGVGPLDVTAAAGDPAEGKRD